MDGFRHKLLSCACFAVNQYGRICVCNERDALFNFLHLRRHRNNIVNGIKTTAVCLEFLGLQRNVLSAVRRINVTRNIHRPYDSVILLNRHRRIDRANALSIIGFQRLIFVGDRLTASQNSHNTAALLRQFRIDLRNMLMQDVLFFKLIYIRSVSRKILDIAFAVCHQNAVDVIVNTEQLLHIPSDHSFLQA